MKLSFFFALYISVQDGRNNRKQPAVGPPGLPGPKGMKKAAKNVVSAPVASRKLKDKIELLRIS